MLARKLKCHSCGGNKINELTTGYIYCDFCGTIIGYDMEIMQKETCNVFSIENHSKPEQKELIQLSQIIAKSIKEKNKDDFINAQLRMHELQFILFPKRFSPKAKQPAYRNRYLNYYKHFWNEKIDKGFFEQSENNSNKFNALSSKLKYENINNKIVYTYDENFKEYIEAMSDFTKESIEETFNFDCIQYYPEQISPALKDVFYKQG